MRISGGPDGFPSPRSHAIIPTTASKSASASPIRLHRRRRQPRPVPLPPVLVPSGLGKPLLSATFAPIVHPPSLTRPQPISTPKRAPGMRRGRLGVRARQRRFPRTKAELSFRTPRRFALEGARPSRSPCGAPAPLSPAPKRNYRSALQRRFALEGARLSRSPCGASRAVQTKG